MGADSVSSTLSSLSKPPAGQDDFDVFAQTRTGVLSAPAPNRWEQEFTSEFDFRLPTAQSLTLRHLPALGLSSSADSRGVPGGPPPTLDVMQPAAVAVSDNQSKRPVTLTAVGLCFLFKNTCWSSLLSPAPIRLKISQISTWTDADFSSYQLVIVIFFKWNSRKRHQNHQSLRYDSKCWCWCDKVNQIFLNQ